MIYNIINKRGVLQDGTPFILDENKPLELLFNDLPNKTYYVVLTQQNGLKKITRKLEGNTFIAKANELSASVWNVELFETVGAKVIDKIICTPILIQRLTNESKGLIAYPEIDSVIKRLAELEKTLATLINWKEEVNPLIHQHEILL